MTDIIYFDSAATTFPKPREALERMIDLYAAKGVSPGRGGYDLALEAEEMVSHARRRLCRLFGGDEPARVAFASNATDALNLVIKLEAVCGKKIKPEQLKEIRSVQDIVDAVEALVNGG